MQAAESRRPKGMPRWEWSKTLNEKYLEQKKLQRNGVETHTLGMIITSLIFIGVLWFIIVTLQSGSAESCGQGYHMEGYGTSYGELVTDCFPD